MAKTSFDDIFESFLITYPLLEIPQTDEGKILIIKNAVKLYNQKAKKYEGRITGNIICNENMEELSVNLSDNEVLILTHLMAKSCAANNLAEFSQVYGVFAKELGFKDYKAQVDSKQNMINYYDSMVDELIEDEIDSFNL